MAPIRIKGPVGRRAFFAFGALIVLFQWLFIHHQHSRLHSAADTTTTTETTKRVNPRRGLSLCPQSTPTEFDWNVKPRRQSKTWQSKDKRRPLNFVHIPKNGGSSVVQAAIDAGLNWGDCLFQQHWSGRSCPHPPKDANWTLEGDALGRVWWHIPISQLPKDQRPNPYEGFDLFGMVRNPYDRAVSEFYYHCDHYPNLCKGLDGRRAARVLNRNVQKAAKTLFHAPAKTADYFLHWGHWIPQYDFFYNRKGQRMVEHLLHTEFLQEEFESLVRSYNYTNLTLPPQPIKKRNDHRMTVQNLTLATIKLLEVVYERDFQVGGYEMWSPKLSGWLEQQKEELLPQDSQ